MNLQNKSKKDLICMIEYRDKVIKELTSLNSYATYIKACKKVEDLAFHLAVADRTIKEYQNWFTVHKVIPSDNNYKMMYICTQSQED